MGDSLTGKAAIVIGGGSGMGSAIARFLASQGASVVVNGPGDAANGAASAIAAAGGRAVASHEPITQFEAAERLVEQAVAAFGGLDIVVTAFPGEPPESPDAQRMIFDIPEREWDATIDERLTGVFNVVRHACAYMRQQRAGRIITLGAPAGLIEGGSAGQSDIGAVSSGIGGFTKVAARDVGRYGVTCNCVVPAPNAAPDDAAPFIGYLASDFAWNVNGQFFYVDGNSVAVLSQPRLERSIIRKEGIFPFEEVRELIPSMLLDAQLGEEGSA